MPDTGLITHDARKGRVSVSPFLLTCAASSRRSSQPSRSVSLPRHTAGSAPPTTASTGAVNAWSAGLQTPYRSHRLIMRCRWMATASSPAGHVQDARRCPTGVKAATCFLRCPGGGERLATGTSLSCASAQMSRAAERTALSTFGQGRWMAACTRDGTLVSVDAFLRGSRRPRC